VYKGRGHNHVEKHTSFQYTKLELQLAARGEATFNEWSYCGACNNREQDNPLLRTYPSQLAPSLLLDLPLVLETHEVYQWHICLSCELSEIDVQLLFQRVQLLTAIISGAQIGLDLGLDTVTTGGVEPSLFPTLWQVRMVREGVLSSVIAQ